MTAIAYRGGYLAADAGVWDGSILSGLCRNKVRRLDDGRLFAGAGRGVDIVACFQWLNTGADPAQRPAAVEREVGFGALVVGEDGEVVRIDRDMRPYAAAPAAFYALGCHYEFLLGALAAGASARDAVALACTFGDGAVGPVQVLHVKDKVQCSEEEPKWRD